MGGGTSKANKNSLFDGFKAVYSRGEEVPDHTFLQSPWLYISEDGEGKSAHPLQKQLEDLVKLPPITLDEWHERAQAISNVFGQFNALARRVGDSIVEELSKPENLRTFTPEANNNMVFKSEKLLFCIFTHDDLEFKLAEHELKSFHLILSAGIPGLCVPLTVINNYRGYRVLCTCEVVVNSLLYGVSNGTMKKDVSPKLRGILEQLRQYLNICTVDPEYGELLLPLECLVFSGPPIQCNNSSLLFREDIPDNMIYFLSTLNMMPPSPPQIGVFSSNFIFKLRPELVLVQPSPVNTNCFTRSRVPPINVCHSESEERKSVHTVTQKMDVFDFSSDIDNDEVSLDLDISQEILPPHVNHKTPEDILTQSEDVLRVMQRRLLTAIIPSFATYWAGQVKKDPSHTNHRRLTEAMHRRGINMRYLGIVLQYLSLSPGNEVAKQHIKVEMVARTCKALLYADFRREPSSNKSQFQVAADHFFKLVTGPGERTNAFWDSTLALHLQYKYGHSIIVKHSDFPEDLTVIIERICEYTGIKYNRGNGIVKEIFSLTKKCSVNLLPYPVYQAFRGRWDDAQEYLRMQITDREREAKLHKHHQIQCISPYMTYARVLSWWHDFALTDANVDFTKRGYEAKQRLLESEQTWKRIIHVRSLCDGSDSFEFYSAMSDLAFFYLVFWMKHTEPNEIIKRLYAFARYYVQKGTLDHAEVLYTRVVQVSERCFGVEHLSRCKAMNKLAMVLIKQGEQTGDSQRYIQGEQLLHNALKIRRRMKHVEEGYSNSEIICLQQLVYIAMLKQSLEEALKWYEEALEVRKKLMGPQDSIVRKMDQFLTSFELRVRAYQESDRAARRIQKVWRGYQSRVELGLVGKGDTLASAFSRSFAALKKQMQHSETDSTPISAPHIENVTIAQEDIISGKISVVVDPPATSSTREHATGFLPPSSQVWIPVHPPSVPRSEVGFRKYTDQEDQSALVIQRGLLYLKHRSSLRAASRPPPELLRELERRRNRMHALRESRTMTSRSTAYGSDHQTRCAHTIQRAFALHLLRKRNHVFIRSVFALYAEWDILAKGRVPWAEVDDVVRQSSPMLDQILTPLQSFPSRAKKSSRIGLTCFTAFEQWSATRKSFEREGRVSDGPLLGSLYFNGFCDMLKFLMFGCSLVQLAAALDHIRKQIEYSSNTRRRKRQSDRAQIQLIISSTENQLTQRCNAFRGGGLFSISQLPYWVNSVSHCVCELLGIDCLVFDSYSSLVRLAHADVDMFIHSLTSLTFDMCPMDLAIKVLCTVNTVSTKSIPICSLFVLNLLEWLKAFLRVMILIKPWGKFFQSDLGRSRSVSPAGEFYSRSSTPIPARPQSVPAIHHEPHVIGLSRMHRANSDIKPRGTAYETSEVAHSHRLNKITRFSSGRSLDGFIDIPLSIADKAKFHADKILSNLNDYETISDTNSVAANDESRHTPIDSVIFRSPTPQFFKDKFPLTKASNNLATARTTSPLRLFRATSPVRFSQI